MKISDSEDPIVRTYIARCYTIFERKGKGVIIGRCAKLYVEVRRLSFEVERLNNRIKELEG
jgi:hypothetical protein